MLSYWINVLISPRCGHSCSALPHIEILIMLIMNDCMTTTEETGAVFQEQPHLMKLSLSAIWGRPV